MHLLLYITCFHYLGNLNYQCLKNVKCSIYSLVPYSDEMNKINNVGFFLDPLMTYDVHQTKANLSKTRTGLKHESQEQNSSKYLSSKKLEPKFFSSLASLA